jgi:hypothetical protein
MRPLLLAALLMLSACAYLSPGERTTQAMELARSAGWQPAMLAAGRFNLLAFLPPGFPRSQTLSIYIEGDGLPWITRLNPSTDPTPVRAWALHLALRHPSGSVAYLARPCQYVAAETEPGCGEMWWTSHRFAEEVIASTNIAIEQLRLRSGAKKLLLIGYSGGGAVAALVAARRSDVAGLITVAGTLDIDAWTGEHNFLPLTGSLNPADFWKNLASVPQIHFVGGRDKVMPLRVAAAYAAHFPSDRQPEIRMIDDFDHTCCWSDNWEKLFPADKFH